MSRFVDTDFSVFRVFSGLRMKAFCPTGPGGGVDPTCSPGGAKKTENEAANRAKFDAYAAERKAIKRPEYRGMSDPGSKEEKIEHGRSTAVEKLIGDSTERILEKKMTLERFAHLTTNPDFRKKMEDHIAVDEQIFKEEKKFVESIIATGVRGADVFNSYDAYSISSEGRSFFSDDGDSKKMLAKAKKTYSGLTEKQYTEARRLHKIKAENQTAFHAGLDSYYGEPETPRSLPHEGMGESGLTSIAPKVMAGGGDEKIRNFFGQAKVVMQVKADAVSKIGQSKTFKNGFQVSGIGKGKSGYRERRKEVEEELFGISRDQPAPGRPIYGHIEHPDALMSSGMGIGDNYGHSQIIFKPSVKSQTSFTVGDSLDGSYLHQKQAGSVSDPPPIKSEFYKRAGDKVKNWDLRDSSGEKPYLEYIEAQIHGVRTIDDIEEVRIPHGVELSAKAIKNFESAGVKITKVPIPISTVYSFMDWDSADKRAKDIRDDN